MGGDARIRVLALRGDDGVASGLRIAGSSGPAILFVHGVGSTAAVWDRQVLAFAPRARCGALELRGNGAVPEPPPAAITRAGYALDAIAALDALGEERAIVVGCSLGGVVAFELARRVPDRLAGLVLVGSFARYPDAENYVRRILAAVEAAGDMETFARARTAQLGLPPERERETITQMACKSRASYEAATRATWTGDYRGDLAAIHVPALVLVGERDEIAPRALSEEIAAGIPGARFAELAGAGHVANSDAPDAFNGRLLAFLEEVAVR